MRFQIQFYFILLAVFYGCSYTIVDTAKLKTMHPEIVQAQSANLSNSLIDSLKSLNFRFRFRDLDLNTFNQTLTAADCRGELMKTDCIIPYTDKLNVLQCISALDFINNDFFPDYPDDESDVFFYFELNGFKKGLRWSFTASDYKHDDKLKSLEKALFNLIDSTDAYEFIKSHPENLLIQY